MTAVRSVFGVMKNDWKVRILFWFMVLCMGLFICMVVILSRFMV